MAGAVPILRVGEIFIATIHDDLDDLEFERLQDEVAHRVGEAGVRGLVVDVSGLEVLDSFATRTLLRMTQVARLRGARSVIVGIQPSVAFAMVQLGLRLDGVETALDVDEGIEVIRAGDGA